MKNVWIMGAALALVMAVAGYTIAQSTGPQAGQGWMMGQGTGMMGSGQGGMMGQGGPGGMMSSSVMNMMMTDRPLTEEQLQQFAEQHGITVEQAKQMTETCAQIMWNAQTPAPKTQ